MSLEHAKLRNDYVKAQISLINSRLTDTSNAPPLPNSSSDPLQRLKVEVYRSLLALYDKNGSFETEEDMNDFDIEDRDDLDFGLTEYEYYANVVKNFDEEVNGQDTSGSISSNSDSDNNSTSQEVKK